MWNKVHDLCPTACPTHLIVDFEIASINAFSQYFHTTKVQVCFFHLCQNVWRKVQQLGLGARYMQDPEFATKVRMLPALAFALPLTFLRYLTISSYNYLLKHMTWHYILKTLILEGILRILPSCPHQSFQWKCGIIISWCSMGCQG